MSLNINVNAGDLIKASDVMSIVNQVNSNETAISGKLSKTGDTMSGSLNMGGNTITNFRTTQSADPATRNYVVTQVAGRLALTGGTMTGAINMGGYKVTNLATPTDNSDGATKNYVDTRSVKFTSVKSWYTTSAGGYNDTFWKNETGYDVLIEGTVIVHDNEGIWVVAGEANGVLHTILTQPVDNNTRYYYGSFTCIVRNNQYLKLDVYDFNGTAQSCTLDMIAYKLALS